MQRRDFLRLAGMAGVAAFAPVRLSTAAPDGARWRLGFVNPPVAELDSGALPLRGELPAGLAGTFYRNGPARHELGGRRYTHWFDGDGMVQAFRFAAGKVTHRGRFVLTPKYRAETQAGILQRAAYGTVFPDSPPVAEPDAINPANINVLPFADRLLALWEAGSAWELDPATLDTLGPVTWREDLQGVAFSAHPRVDRDGTLWNFGLETMQGALVLYRISPQGVLERAEAIALGASPAIHDFVITDRHLLFLLPPLRLDLNLPMDSGSFLDRHRWYGDEPLRVLVVDKSDWSRRRWYELPTGFVFHLGNAWEDKAGVIRFDYVRYDDASFPLQSGRALMRGDGGWQPRGQLALVRLDTRSGRIEQEVLPSGSVEFPRVDPRLTGGRYRNLYLASRDGTPEHPTFNAVLRYDMDSGTSDTFSYGTAMIAEEHIFVPDPAGKSDGWVIGTALDLVGQTTVLSVFAAERLADGPLAQATLPYALPLGLHGNFAAARG